MGDYLRCVTGQADALHVSGASLSADGCGKSEGLQDIHDVVRNGLWTWNTTVRALTMSEMVVMFGYVYRELKPLQLAKEMGIHTKTVNTFLYTGLAKNGMQSLNVRHLVCGVT